MIHPLKRFELIVERLVQMKTSGCKNLEMCGQTYPSLDQEFNSDKGDFQNGFTCCFFQYLHPWPQAGLCGVVWRAV